MDPAVVRGRRGLEWAGLISRAAAVVLMIASFILQPMDGLDRIWSGPPWQFAVLLSIPLVLTNWLGVVALRHAAHRRYSQLSALIAAADTATILGATVAVSFDPDIRVWPLLITPILLAAYRHQLVGAGLAWVATTTAAVMLHRYSVPLLGHQLDQDLVMIVPGLNLSLAIMAGTLANANHSNLTKLVATRAELRHQAQHDALTGVGNRSLLYERGQALLASGRPASVLLLDLDGFKAVNDRLGHAAGDELLRVLADRLCGCARADDLIARLGGDEFVVMLPSTNRATADRFADRLRAVLTEPVRIGEQQVVIDASIGIATGSALDRSLDASPNRSLSHSLDRLLREADADMYRVKDTRRKQCVPAATGIGTRVL